MPAPSDPAARAGALRARLRVGDLLLPDAVTRSYLADDRVVGWYGEPGVVIDAEIADQPVPEALARSFGAEDFWPRWTRAECAAKLADVPIFLWARLHGLDPGPFVGTVHTLHLDDLVVSVGFPPSPNP